MAEPPEVDARGHAFGCRNFSRVTIPNPLRSHVDLFCECHAWDKPRILANGSDIAWPAGWSRKQAADWRRENHLVSPTKVRHKHNGLSKSIS